MFFSEAILGRGERILIGMMINNLLYKEGGPLLCRTVASPEIPVIMH